MLHNAAVFIWHKTTKTNCEVNAFFTNLCNLSRLYGRVILLKERGRKKKASPLCMGLNAWVNICIATSNWLQSAGREFPNCLRPCCNCKSTRAANYTVFKFNLCLKTEGLSERTVKLKEIFLIYQELWVHLWVCCGGKGEFLSPAALNWSIF